MLTRRFKTELDMSQAQGVDAIVTTILLREIPGAAGVKRAPLAADRLGVDYWVSRHHPRFPLAVDLKMRREDWKPKGEDDLALETFSVVETAKIGWTRDPNKCTDYVLWLWQDTHRWVLVPFAILCQTFTEHWQEWRGVHKKEVQASRGDGAHDRWQSECVLVPRAILWKAMMAHAGGHEALAPPPDGPMDMTVPSFDELGTNGKPGSVTA